MMIIKETNEPVDWIKEYVKCLDAEHKLFIKEYLERPNKGLDESFNNLSEEAKFLLELMLPDIMGIKNEQTNSQEKDGEET